MDMLAKWAAQESSDARGKIKNYFVFFGTISLFTSYYKFELLFTTTNLCFRHIYIFPFDNVPFLVQEMEELEARRERVRQNVARTCDFYNLYYHLVCSS